MKASAGKGRVLIIVENLPCPFDRRVWQEATTLVNSGYEVSIICPKGKGYDRSYEIIDGVHIYRHWVPMEGEGLLGYIVEYSVALLSEFLLSLRVLFTRGFDVVHACNPPDTIFLIGLFYKIFGKKFVFDHHDINPELFEAKFGKRGFSYWLVVQLERLTFMAADISIATNESYKKIAMSRGRMPEDKVYIVRSGPNLEWLKPVAPDEGLKKGKRHLVGYLGVMGAQEGIDYLLRSVRHIVYELDRRDIHFVLVGGGTELDKMIDLATELEVEDYVDFTGRVPDAELLSVLSTADVCVNPDPATEMNDKSTMNKIMEYMALSKPIVQFDLTEGRVSAQDSSLYAEKDDEIDFAEKIVTLLDDEPKRLEMGEKGRVRVESSLSWSHQAPILLDAYGKLLDV